MTTTMVQLPEAEPVESSPDFVPAEAVGTPMAFVAPRFPHDPRWPWITEIGPMRSFRFHGIRVENIFKPVPKLTKPYIWLQHQAAKWQVRPARIVFLFGDDVGAPLATPLARKICPGERFYVGFTQDGHWPQRRMHRFGLLLRRCAMVTMFTQEEAEVYIRRYDLDRSRVRISPIHTDETDGYQQYPDTSPRARPYVLSLGSPNRRFMPVARACRDLGVDLIIITRPGHRNDSLDELASMGAAVITDADKMRSLTYLKHARLAVAAFDDPTVPGGFTTLVHAMFLRTPFVLTQCLGMAEHVIDGETGFITPHEDEGALREAIGRLWEDPDLAERFGETAALRGRKYHSLEYAAETYARLALEVLGIEPQQRGPAAGER